MKNLFLPFVVVALFAVGSCGDDASINPPVKQEEQLKQVEIIAINPDSAYAGGTIHITGKNFSPNRDENNIEFTPGIAATVDSATSTQLWVKVPGAALSGPIIVSNGKFNDTSGSFTILKEPSLMITDFTPKSGEAGTEVIISGVKFGTDKQNVQVYFGSTNIIAPIQELTDTSIKIIVPEKAKTGTIKVRINNQTVTSNSNFVMISPFPVTVSNWNGVYTNGIPYLIHRKSNGFFGDYDSTEVLTITGFTSPTAGSNFSVKQTGDSIFLRYYFSQSTGDPRDISASNSLSLYFRIDTAQKKLFDLAYGYGSSVSIVHTTNPRHVSNTYVSLHFKEAPYTIVDKSIVVDLSGTELQNAIKEIYHTASGECCMDSKLSTSFISMLALEPGSSFKIIMRIE